MNKHHYRVTVYNDQKDEYATLHVRLESPLPDGCELDCIATMGLRFRHRRNPESKKYWKKLAPTKMQLFNRYPWDDLPLKFAAVLKVTESGDLIRSCQFWPEIAGVHTCRPFIWLHPTKTGGTAAEFHLLPKFRPLIVGIGHENTSEDEAALRRQLMMLVRDPLDRFRSMYLYWKRGSQDGPFRRNKKNVPGLDIQGFRKMVDEMDMTKLRTWYTEEWHYEPQANWLKECSWSRAHVGFYTKNNLGGVLTQMVKNMGLLGLGHANLKLPVVNKSKRPVEEDLTLSDEDMVWLRARYAADYKLIEAMEKTPELFKSVSGTRDA